MDVEEATRVLSSNVAFIFVLICCIWCVGFR